MNFKATIKRGEPMPSICQICSSMKRCKTQELSEIPTENPCFVSKVKERGWEDMQPEFLDKILAYQPFTNSKRTVQTVCNNFSHIRSATYR